MNKPTKPNITIPASFGGVKVDFDNDHLTNGFPQLTPDVLPGDCLNKFIDDTYKGLNFSIDCVDDLYKGIVLYSATETYDNTSLVFDISGTDIKLYHSLVDNNLGNPLTDTTKWELASSTNYDGQWISSSNTLVTGGSISSNTDKSYDLSSYLPNDNYKYEVLGYIYGNTPATSGKYVNMFVKSSECNYISVSSAVTRTNAYVRFGGSFIIPIGTGSNRKIIFNDTGDGCTGVEIALRAYRRIGTNL